MRRSDKEITDPEIISEILENADVCRLGLIDNGLAYIVPVNYIYHEGCLYFHSAFDGRKMEILKSNKKLTFEIDIYEGIEDSGVHCRCTTKYKSIIGVAVADFIERDDEKVRVLNKIMLKYRKEDVYFDADKVNTVSIVKIYIESMAAKRSPAIKK